jgi:hypothetical protein
MAEEEKCFHFCCSFSFYFLFDEDFLFFSSSLLHETELFDERRHNSTAKNGKESS